jgi:uncharacterized membrane protein
MSPETGGLDVTTIELLKEWLAAATEYASFAIDAVALVVIVIGTIEAVLNSGRLVARETTAHEKRLIWLRYSRWLVAGLTFQLASDIIYTSVAPSWDELGRLAVIAIIRTVLNYFLEKDLSEMREKDEATA